MITAKVTGIADLRAALSSIPAKLRVRALRNALAAGARVVQKAARAATPVINASAMAVRKGYRKPGTVKKAISVRTSKLARQAGNVGVFVNVRPAKGAVFRNGIQVRAKQRGAKSPNDPYYWSFLNFGRTGRAGQGARLRRARNKVLGIKGIRFHRAMPAVGPMRAFRFMERGADMLPTALAVFLQTIGPQLDKLNRPKAPPP